MTGERVTLPQIVDALRPRRNRLAALWDAVTSGCDFCNGRGSDHGGTVPCEPCSGLGRVPRDVSSWPDGAVAGMLGKVASQIDADISHLEWMSTRLRPSKELERKHALWRAVREKAQLFDDPAALAATLAAVDGTPVDEDTEAEAR